MNRYDQHVAAGGQMDGTEDKGLFSEANLPFQAGGIITQLLVALGSGANKSVELSIQPPGAAEVIVWGVYNIPDATHSASITSETIAFAKGDQIRVKTTNADGPIFASLYTISRDQVA